MRRKVKWCSFEEEHKHNKFVLCCVVLCCGVLLCCVVLWYGMVWCGVLLCCVVVWCGVLCYVMLNGYFMLG